MCLCVPGLTETTRMRCIVKAPWSRGIWRNSAASIDRPPANCIALEPLVIEWLAFIHLLIIIMLAMLTLYIYVFCFLYLVRIQHGWHRCRRVLREPYNCAIRCVCECVSGLDVWRIVHTRPINEYYYYIMIILNWIFECNLPICAVVQSIRTATTTIH